MVLCPLLVPEAEEQQVEGSYHWRWQLCIASSKKKHVDSFCMKTPEQSRIFFFKKKPSALQAQQVQMTARTIKALAFNALQSRWWNLDFNEPKGEKWRKHKLDKRSSIGPDQTSANLRRSQQEGRLPQRKKKKPKNIHTEGKGVKQGCLRLQPAAKAVS